MFTSTYKFSGLFVVRTYITPDKVLQPDVCIHSSKWSTQKLWVVTKCQFLHKEFGGSDSEHLYEQDSKNKSKKFNMIKYQNVPLHEKIAIWYPAH